MLRDCNEEGSAGDKPVSRENGIISCKIGWLLRHNNRDEGWSEATMPDGISNSEIDAILRRQFSSGDSVVKCDRNDPEEVAAYLEGALSSRRIADFEQHLINCADCRRAVIELRALELDENPTVADAAGAEAIAGEPVASEGFI